MTRKEAIDRLIHYIADMCTEERRLDVEWLEPVLDFMVINPCDNCVGPALAIAHGYTDMRTNVVEEKK